MNTGIHSLEGIQPGDIYTTDGRDVWEVTSLSQQPTIELKNLRTGEQTGGVVGSPHVSTFVPLVRLDRFNALALEDSKVKTP